MALIDSNPHKTREATERKAINNILFPTDFSETAHNAFEYCLHIAEALDARITLLHVYYNSPVDTRFIPADFIQSIKEEKVEKALELISTYQQEAKDNCNKKVEVRPILESGYATDVIVRLSKELDIDMIIMGTLGAESYSEKILGSVTAKVIERAKCPVLAVPSMAKYSPIHHIMYAANFDQTDFSAIDQLLDLAEPLGARLSCTHIHTDNQYWDKVEMSFLEKLYQTEIQEDKVAFYISNSTNVINGIQHFINNHKVDILTMVTKERDILERIYGDKSITREMALYTDVPLLALHG